MSIFDIFKRKQAGGTGTGTPSKAMLSPGRPLRGSGQLRDFSVGSYLPRPAQTKYNPIEILETLVTFNPDISLAVWNFLRLVNPSCELTAVISGKEQQTDEDGLNMLKERLDVQYGAFGRDYGGGLSALVNVTTLSLLIHGAVAGELELSDDVKDVTDWCPVDPRVVYLKSDEKTRHLNPMAMVSGVEISLSPEQFRYIALDPLISNPYGRGPLLPTLDTAFFQTEVLRDIKAVAHTSGHPRIQFSVVEEIAESHVPASLKVAGKEDEYREWMDGWLTAVKEGYETLQPDDALFTWDWVKAEMLSAGKASYDLDSLVKVVEQQVIGSCKQLPILLGRIDGSGLAHGTVQWQIFAAGVQSLRETVRALISWWATQTLRIWGRPSIADLVFPTIRTQDRLAEAQAEQIEVNTAISMWSMGWVSNDELANKFTGHAQVNEPLAASGGASQSSSKEGGNGKKPAEIPASAKRAVTEASLFHTLPLWIRKRAEAVEWSVSAMADVRRAQAFDELMNGD